ncbi:MAG TPA: C45 family peptidase [Polyangiaceae bacterium]|nr:C45 family peptidase [Polyangiaceae bacterium]
MRAVKLTLLTLAIALGLTSTGLAVAVSRSAITPPPTAVDLSQPGPGRAERVEGVWFLWFAGPPELRGADMYRLSGEVMGRIDRSMHETFSEVVPSWPLRKAIEAFGRIAARDLGEDIPVEIQREIVGQVHAYPDPFGDGGGKFSRFLSYLALHDLAQTIEKSPLIACSGFAATGPASASGGTLLGRNFDFEAGRIFDEEKSIAVFTPERGHRFATVSWPGMNGVVTGVNDRRVWVSVNAARSDHEASRGVPVSILIRQVLEAADDAEHAARLLQAARTRVADLFLVGDPARALVVEKTPLRAVVRGPERDRLVVTNHFLDPALRAEERNQKLERETSSRLRFERLRRRVAEASGPLDVGGGLSVLRDRAAPDGEPYPVGDRRAIDGYIATHGVLADLGRDALWVSRAPHLSNAWLGVKLGPLFEGRVEQVESLPADEESLRAGASIGYRSPGK